MAFQFFLDDIEQIKRKVALLKSLDYDMFEEIFIDHAKFQIRKAVKDQKNKKQSSKNKFFGHQSNANYKISD